MTVTARYLAPLAPGVVPYTYTYQPADKTTKLVLHPLKAYTLPISDVRQPWSVEGPNLNDDGLQLVLGDASMGIGMDNGKGDFDSDSKVESVYHPQVTALLTRLIESGGHRRVKKTVVFDHTVRRRKDLKARISGNSASGVSVNPKEREPVGTTHGDYTDVSGPQRVRDLVGGEEAERLLKENRWAIVNLWKPIAGPIYDAPLAFIAPGTVNPASDFLPHKLLYPDRIGETLAVKHNPSHRFIYASQMTTSDVWAFKTYDSQTGVAKVTPHTGIEEPNEAIRAKQAGKGRESIEVRVLVFWDEVGVSGKL